MRSLNADMGSLPDGCGSSSRAWSSRTSVARSPKRRRAVLSSARKLLMASTPGSATNVTVNTGRGTMVRWGRGHARAARRVATERVGGEWMGKALGGKRARPESACANAANAAEVGPRVPGIPSALCRSKRRGAVSSFVEAVTFSCCGKRAAHRRHQVAASPFMILSTFLNFIP
jgi:hypothetical protein